MPHVLCGVLLARFKEDNGAKALRDKRHPLHINAASPCVYLPEDTGTSSWITFQLINLYNTALDVAKQGVRKAQSEATREDLNPRSFLTELSQI